MFFLLGILGITKVLPSVFSIIILGLCGASQEAFAADFGDAPASYGVAEHTTCGPIFGSICDNEVASQFSANADGDDLNPIIGLDD